MRAHGFYSVPFYLSLMFPKFLNTRSPLHLELPPRNLLACLCRPGLEGVIQLIHRAEEVTSAPNGEKFETTRAMGREVFCPDTASLPGVLQPRHWLGPGEAEGKDSFHWRTDLPYHPSAFSCREP